MSIKIAVLSGGVGGSRFVLGLRDAIAGRWPDGAGGVSAEVTVIANTGDDLWLSGLRIQPDIDSLLYALAGVNDTERGWGRTGETERVAEELRHWGAGWPWFTLGDLDLATHIARTGWLRDGASVSDVVTRLSNRWPLGVRLLPMTDAEVDTQVVIPDGRMHFQEWWTRHRASIPALRFESPGIGEAQPAPGVLAAIAEADAILLAPSNPIVSIGPILAVPGIADAIRHSKAGVAGVSPIIAGSPVRGMADACLHAVGIPTSADAVGLYYGARHRETAGGPGLLDAWLVAEEDAALAPSLARSGLDARVRPLWMRDRTTSASLADAALEAAIDHAELGAGGARSGAAGGDDLVAE